MEVRYPVWKRLRAFAGDAVPEECKFGGSKDTFAGVQQDPVSL